ncbi:MAG: winged helix-turn-helix transcriptional regulator, partial [Prevotellaceae bacterium]|nr:winged helix-turn-helix transcriptional regulator [Prevotellaceae bacterium]
VPDSLTENQKKILEELLKNNNLSMSELATTVGISKRKILDNINKLKDLNMLERIGKNKTGYWKIKK